MGVFIGAMTLLRILGARLIDRLGRSRSLQVSLVTSLIGLILFTTLSMVAAVLIQWFFIARRAEQVAEISALAAVGASVRGDSPCPAAADAAGRNAASVVGCDVRGSGRSVVVDVVVRAPLEPQLGWGPSEVLRAATAGT